MVGGKGQTICKPLHISSNPCNVLWVPHPAKRAIREFLQSLALCLSVWLTFCLCLCLSISQNLKRYYDIEAVASDRNDRKLTEAKERYTNNWRRIQALHKRLQLLEYRHVPFVSFTWPETLFIQRLQTLPEGGWKKKLARKVSQRINKKKTLRRLVEQHIQNKNCERVDQESRKNSAKKIVSREGRLLTCKKKGSGSPQWAAGHGYKSIPRSTSSTGSNNTLWSTKALVSLALVSIAPSMLVPIWNGLSTDRSDLEWSVLIIRRWSNLLLPSWAAKSRKIKSALLSNCSVDAYSTVEWFFYWPFHFGIVIFFLYGLPNPKRSTPALLSLCSPDACSFLEWSVPGPFHFAIVFFLHGLPQSRTVKPELLSIAPLMLIPLWNGLSIDCSTLE